MKVLLTGGSGLLGQAIIKELEKNNINYYAPSSELLNIRKEKDFSRNIDLYNPDVIIHCAAYTNVDKAEWQIEKDKCREANVLSMMNLLEVCRNKNIYIIFISSNYVFDGELEGKYRPKDAKNPINIYGFSKAKGEDILLDSSYRNFNIVRTSSLFGPGKDNFVSTMLELSKTQNEIAVVNDQFTMPTYTEDLAKAIIEMLNFDRTNYQFESDREKIYQITNQGEPCSYADFARYILKDTDVTIKEVSSEEYQRRYEKTRNGATRPKNGVLEFAFPNPMPTWQDAVDRYLESLKNE